MVKNVYIHIPFCKSKCKYCSFISFPKLELKKQYIHSLIEEIKILYKKECLNTLYFGGGTPSLLTPEEFNELLYLFNMSIDTEITTELNPETITYDYLKNLRKIGINRLSFGCQTFNDRILHIIGRRHMSKDVETSVNSAKQAGFNNISIDFIYGLPDQTLKGFENDLYKAVQLDIQHISLYGLKIDEGCYFEKHTPVNLPDDDMQAEMYLKAIEILTNNGFKHYEISNFCKEGYASRHNLNYWDNNTYYGFGVAAHGYENGIRYYNTSNLDEYINNPLTNKVSHKLTLQEQLEEEIFLGFRKNEGINIEKINKKFNIDFLKKYANTINKYISYKYLKETNTGFKLTNEGILISNTILSEFIE
ncbi:MAG TPA: radical SAM family heme chaperone HemW [Candidatus Stercorousia faecigallinarum]|nr:radical SAM family heme chaperone HemW [Candidatus Stercorousia faecigallinarum]